LIGTLPVLGTEGKWKPQSTLVSGAAGVQDVFFVFRGAAGEELFKFDYWQFSPNAEASQPAPKALANPAHNPLIWADVPDIAIIRVGKDLLHEQHDDAHEPGPADHEVDGPGQLAHGLLRL
jgi:hypothetical protein